jgi:hypothetical protein
MIGARLNARGARTSQSKSSTTAANRHLAPRKYKPRINAAPDNYRFRPDDIFCAIETVERAGLTVRGVEITKSGSIKIETGPKVAASDANAKCKEQPPSVTKSEL